MAGGKAYSLKECESISGAIDFLLSITAKMWDKLKKNPNDEKSALELSWAVDMAANYTTIYTAFCKDNKKDSRPTLILSTNSSQTVSL